MILALGAAALLVLALDLRLAGLERRLDRHEVALEALAGLFTLPPPDVPPAP